MPTTSGVTFAADFRRIPSVNPREGQKFTRRQYLTYECVMRGTPMLMAIEAVATTAIEHPEWNMDEEMTWAEWQATSQPATDRPANKK